MGVHVAGTQHGHTYYLGPLEGTRAPALVALRSRAPAANVDFWPLQHTIWQIEGGLSYNDISADSQQLIDRLIPEYKGQLRDNFVKSMQKSCGGILGRFAGSLCNEANALNERYQQVQQTLQRYANNYEALGQQIVHVIPGEYQNPGPASWSQLSPRVYARVAGGHIWQEMSTLEIRVLPRSGVANATTSSPPASFHNVSYSLTGTEAGIGNDTAEVPIGAVIAYPDSGVGVQVLGPTPVPAPPTQDPCSSADNAPVLSLVAVPFQSRISLTQLGVAVFQIAAQVRGCNGEAIQGLTVGLSACMPDQVGLSCGPLTGLTRLSPTNPKATDGKGTTYATLVVQAQASELNQSPCTQTTQGWCYRALSFPTVRVTAKRGSTATSIDVSTQGQEEVLDTSGGLSPSSWSSAFHAPIAFNVGYAHDVKHDNPGAWLETVCNKLVPVANAVTDCAITAATVGCALGASCPVAVIDNMADPSAVPACASDILGVAGIQGVPTPPDASLQTVANFLCWVSPSKIGIIPGTPSASGSQSVQVQAFDDQCQGVQAYVFLGLLGAPGTGQAVVKNPNCLRTSPSGLCPALIPAATPLPWPFLVGRSGATITYTPGSSGTAQLVASLNAGGNTDDSGTAIYTFGSPGNNVCTTKLQSETNKPNERNLTLQSQARMPDAREATGAKIVKAMIQEQATSLELPPGQMYLYGMTTGGGAPSSGFTTGQYAQVVNAAGKLSAALAYGTNSQNSYSTQTAYHEIGGVSVAGSWENFTAYYGSNRQTGAHDASVSFQANEDSLVVVLGLASGQQFISVEGIPNLQVDASRNGGGMVITHAYVKPGTYNVIEHSKVLAAGQDPAHMADLVGVFVFGGSQPSNQAVAASELPRAAGTKGSIRSVDFRNFDYPYDKPGEVIHVSNGKWDKVVANAEENYEEHYAVGKVIYGDLIGDGHEEAAVLTSDWGAANFQFAHILVYAMSSMGPSLLQELEQSSSAKGNDIDWTRVRDVRIANRELLIVADEGQCHACTDWIVTAKYQWNGKLFVRTALLRKPVQK